MNSVKESKHPKQVIIEYYDSLVNEVDIYVEELNEIYNDNETLGESESQSESRAKLINEKKRSLIKEDKIAEENQIVAVVKKKIRRNSDSEEDGEMYAYSEDDDEEDYSSSGLSSSDDDAEDTESEYSQDEEMDENENNQDVENEATIDLNTYSYYDKDESVANEVDERIASQEELYGIEQFRDPYEINFKPSGKFSHFEVEGQNKSTKTRDYLNRMRSLMIDEIRKMEKRSLDELNKGQYECEFDKDSSAEEMRKKLFKDRFCFLIDTQADQNFSLSIVKPKNERIFSLCLIITDFYLNESQVNLIRIYLDREKQKSGKSRSHILNEGNLCLQIVTQNIRYELRNHNHELEMLWINKRCLQEPEKIDYYFKQIRLVSLSKPLNFDFSRLKSLSKLLSNYLYSNKILLTDEYPILKAISQDSSYKGDYSDCEVKDLSGLSNLEYLEIGYMFISEHSFEGLEKLVKLVLNHCEAKVLDAKTFASQRNLQFLQINKVNFNVRLASLVKLRVLALLCIDDFRYIKSVPSKGHLEISHLNTHHNWRYLDLDSVDSFFNRVNLSRLPRFHFTRNSFCDMETPWFSRLTNVKRISLYDNKLLTADFFKNVNLTHILELDLSCNKIKKLGKSIFSGLTNLKSLNLSKNPLKELKSGVFRGLENLEILLLRDIKGFIIEKNAFIGLSNLKTLDLSGCSSDILPPEAFDQTPELKCLRLKNSKLGIKMRMIPRLKQLKEIVLYPSDLVYYKFNKQAQLHFKVIKEM